MTTYLYQIADDQDEAEMMGGQCSLIIVDKDSFADSGALDDDHILDGIVATTGRQDLYDHLDEVAESMFVSDLEPDALRTFLGGIEEFEEATLFEDA